MSDDVPVYRHWILLRTLGARRHGLTVREMAREMDVAEKTIRRDLALFQRLGFPLMETNGERGRKTWRLAGGGSAPPLQFTFDEAVVLYLMAFDPRHDQVRRYKLDRIESVEISSFTFQRPADFDVSACLAGSFGIYDGDGDVTVVVKFLPAAVRYVLESKRHASQVSTRQRDGSLLAQFQLTTTVEIKGWILSFGGNAIVLEPDSLRAEIAGELERLLKAYHELMLKT